MTIHVRKWDDYQYELRVAKKRRRISFEIDAALLSPHFQGRGGAARLGQWLKVLAWAGKLNNELPSSTAWWRENFGRHGDEWRDKLLEWDWCDSKSPDSNADLNADSNADSQSDSESGISSGDSKSEPDEQSDPGHLVLLTSGVDSPPDLEVELEKPTNELQHPSTTDVAQDAACAWSGGRSTVDDAFLIACACSLCMFEMAERGLEEWPEETVSPPVVAALDLEALSQKQPSTGNVIPLRPSRGEVNGRPLGDVIGGLLGELRKEAG